MTKQNLDNIKIIMNNFKRCNMFSFYDKDELEKWLFTLEEIEIKNLISLNTLSDEINFFPDILVKHELLKRPDFLNIIKTFMSIKNADTCDHLFKNMLSSCFLNNPNFYRDIEIMKQAITAKYILFIIGEEVFINSPYHDEDLNLLVTARDNADGRYNNLLWENIANIANSQDSIQSPYHKEDLELILKYSSSALQSTYCYPRHSISHLAINPVSLKDNYHLENMELLATNSAIGNFLYPIMTTKEVIESPYYRLIIDEMIKHQDRKEYVALLCLYAVGKKAAKQALCNDELYLYEELDKLCDLELLLNFVKKRLESLNTVDSDCQEIHYIEHDETGTNPPSVKSLKNLFKNIIKK